ncbi:carbon storage regulator CsrA [Legionella rubrilucens]|uniref:Carbon storage regulator CsrA n=1 Tax=Legionella rubrilucens TaxID=458 RepID=A0A0W0XXD7_9GAMM|nr:carbon storage regulator [Legionella rubrilucens]KTD49521.1 carbon storage regulator CsrA [Legionella rubrilucens]
MDIINVSFEKPFTVLVSGEAIEVIVFKTLEEGNIKFGIKAPRSVNVHREEIYHAIKQKEQLLESE